MELKTFNLWLQKIMIQANEKLVLFTTYNVGLQYPNYALLNRDREIMNCKFTAFDRVNCEDKMRTHLLVAKSLRDIPVGEKIVPLHPSKYKYEDWIGTRPAQESDEEDPREAKSATKKRKISKAFCPRQTLCLSFSEFQPSALPNTLFG